MAIAQTYPNLVSDAAELLAITDLNCGRVTRNADGVVIGRLISPGDRTDFLLALILAQINTLRCEVQSR